MNKRWLVPLCIVGALLLSVTCFAGVIWLSFSGNPFHRLAVTNRVKTYLQETYPEQPYVTQFAVYDFKMGLYLCNEELPGSPDAAFTVYEERNGSLRDDYQERIDRHYNTKIRLNNALMDEIDIVFSQMPYRCRFLYGEVTVWQEDSLVKDMPADAYFIPGETMLAVWMETQEKEPTWEELEQRLPELAAYANEKGLSFDKYAIMLEYPYENAGTREVEDLRPICFDSIVDSGAVSADIINDETMLHMFLQERRAVLEQEQKALAFGTYEKMDRNSVEEE